MNIGGIILFKILEDPKHENSLEAWGKLKLNFFTSEYRSIYTYLSNFYDKNSILPSFEDIKVTNRNSLLGSNIRALEKLEVDENIDVLIACSALLDEYTQDQALKRIDTLIDNITFLDTEEIKSELGNMVLELEEETFDNQHIIKMDNIMISSEEEVQGERLYLGINNNFDSDIMARTQDYILMGGFRGSGKTITVCNACISQHKQGNASLFFSIEMPGRQIFNRYISILSGVAHDNVSAGKFTEQECIAMAETRRDMFEDSQPLFEEFLKHKNLRKFEEELVSKKKLTENELIIIDNQRLTLTDIDIAIQKYKTRFGDRLKLVVVDYVNQIEIKDQFNWQQQIFLSKQLKTLARKHNVLILSPYQIDEKGNTRLSKGLLDSPDMAIILKAGKDYINFESVKTRSTKPFNFTSGMAWSTLTIDPEEVIIQEEENDEEPRKQGKEDSKENLPF